MTAVPSVAVPLRAATDAEVPTLGVEEEFLLLWPDGHAAPVAPELLAAVPPEARATAEFSRCQVEMATGICSELDVVGRELSVSRRILAQAAADHGARLVPAGTPPLDVPGAELITDDPRYRRLVSVVPGVTGEEVTCAAHVHVEVAGRDLAVAVLARLRPWLPVLLALAANSPLWQGRDTGWCSHRFVVQRRWPSFVSPPRCADAAAYDARVARLIAARAAFDERGVYYWARLSPRYPTVEIRLADACLTVADAVLLAGLCRAVVMTAVDDELAGRPFADVPDRALVTGAYAAARRGLSAVVASPLRPGWAPADVLLDELVAYLAPALEAAGDRSLVDTLLASRLRRGSGAHRQRALWRRSDGAAYVQALANLGAGVDPAA